MLVYLEGAKERRERGKREKEREEQREREERNRRQAEEEEEEHGQCISIMRQARIRVLECSCIPCCCEFRNHFGQGFANEEHFQPLLDLDKQKASS